MVFTVATNDSSLWSFSVFNIFYSSFKIARSSSPATLEISNCIGYFARDFLADSIEKDYKSLIKNLLFIIFLFPIDPEISILHSLEFLTVL